MMHLVLGDGLCAQMNSSRNDWPFCCACRKPVDWFGRKIEIDKMAGRSSAALEASPSYSRLYVVMCHGERGMLKLNECPIWQPGDPRPDFYPYIEYDHA